MNLAHRWLCRSRGWRNAVESYVMPWTLEGIELPADVLEIGPGPGVTTDLLRHRVARLTCVEIDRSLARRLERRTAGSNVRIVRDDATAMALPDAAFDAVVCFTMLHHVPSPALQDRLLAEAARVLRPGGLFVGTDSLYSRSMRWLHLFDTMVLVDPAGFPARLQAAGFEDVHVDVNPPWAFRFRARRPPLHDPGQ